MVEIQTKCERSRNLGEGVNVAEISYGNRSNKQGGSKKVYILDATGRGCAHTIPG